jgi:hypothetical protein
MAEAAAAANPFSASRRLMPVSRFGSVLGSSFSVFTVILSNYRAWLW